MFKILLAAADTSSFGDFKIALEESGENQVNFVESGQAALDKLAESSVDLAIADEELGDMTAMEFAGKLLMVNPMINCALVSSLSEEDFHETSEGLGVLARLPKNPGRQDSENIMAKLKKIKAIEFNVNT